MAQKYYWLKLKRDFFKRHDIRVVEDMPNGKDYVLFYLKLLVESIDHDGELRFAETIPYNEQMLASVTNTNVDIVRQATKIFYELGMLELLDDGTIYMSEVHALMGSETAWAEKKRLYRGQSGDNVLAMSDKSKSKSKSIEIDIKESKEKSKAFKPPTKEEVQTYIRDNNYKVDAQRFIDYYESNGWKVGKNSMKDWKAAVRSWNAREKTEAPKETSYDVEKVKQRAQQPIVYERK